MSQLVPIIPTIPNPVLLDFEIAKIQMVLGNLTWLQYIFGRAWLFEEDRNNRPDQGLSDIKVAKVFEGQTSAEKEGNYREVFPNDNWDSYCFFYAESQETTDNYSNTRRAFSNYTRPMSLIFWVDLFKIDSAKNYIFTEELKYQVLQELKKVPGVEITGYIDGNFKEVFQGFEPYRGTNRKNIRYPYAGFRFFFNLSYDEGAFC